MTVEADIFTLLKTVCPRVFPDFAPVATVRPYVTYQQIGGEVVNYTDNTISSIKNGDFQVNVWADTRASASAMALQIEAAMITATAFQARPNSAPAGDFDADVPVYGSIQDFSVWSSR